MAMGFIAILVAAIAAMVLGFIWYSPQVFGNEWMKLMKIGKKQIAQAKKKGMSKTYLTMLISSLLTSYILASFIALLGITEAIDGALLAVMLWLGFIATTTLSSILWEGKPAKLYILNNGYHLVSLVVMGIILALWS